MFSLCPIFSQLIYVELIIIQILLFVQTENQSKKYVFFWELFVHDYTRLRLYSISVCVCVCVCVCVWRIQVPVLFPERYRTYCGSYVKEYPAPVPTVDQNVCESPWDRVHVCVCLYVLCMLHTTYTNLMCVCVNIHKLKYTHPYTNTHRWVGGWVSGWVGGCWIQEAMFCGNWPFFDHFRSSTCTIQQWSDPLPSCGILLLVEIEMWKYSWKDYITTDYFEYRRNTCVLTWSLSLGVPVPRTTIGRCHMYLYMNTNTIPSVVTEILIPSVVSVDTIFLILSSPHWHVFVSLSPSSPRFRGMSWKHLTTS